MKKTLIALFALAGMASGATLSLDSSLVQNSTGTAQSAFELCKSSDPSGTFNRNQEKVFEGDSNNNVKASFSFYVNVSELYNASSINDTDILTLNSLSFLGNNSGWYTGGNRQVTVSNGTDSVTVSLNESSNRISSANFSTTDFNEFTFNVTDTLTFLIEATDVASSLAIRWYDPNGGYSMPAVSFTQNADGTANDGDDHTKNPFDTNVKYNAPIIRLGVTVTQVPEPATASLSLLGLAALMIRRRRA